LVQPPTEEERRVSMGVVHGLRIGEHVKAYNTNQVGAVVDYIDAHRVRVKWTSGRTTNRSAWSLSSLRALIANTREQLESLVILDTEVQEMEKNS